jgi:ATPase subunit of ABC transporter with duplicated ATPase domains
MDRAGRRERAGKSTLLRLVAGELRPQQGWIRTDPDGAEVVLCRQDVEVPGDDVRALAERDDGPAWQLRGGLALDAADLERWSTLSPGERRRWQVGAALARKPRVLLLDEPTNHLDGKGRALVVAALERFLAWAFWFPTTVRCSRRSPRARRGSTTGSSR